MSNKDEAHKQNKIENKQDQENEWGMIKRWWKENSQRKQNKN